MSGLKAFRDPASSAVVGASDHPAKWGFWLAEGALPEAPELVALCVPGGAVPSLVAEGLSRGTRALLTVSAGVPDHEGLARLLEQHKARMIVPNSLGLYDASTDLQLTWGTFAPGGLAIVSQSGQLGSEVADLAARSGLGISRFVAVGTQLDVTADDLLADLRTHEQTEIVALYLENFSDGETLVGTLRAYVRAGKPTILLAVGASEGSRRSARSHTGALTCALDVVDAACRASGTIRVSTPTELVGVAQLLMRHASPTGRRVAVLSDSGGQGAGATDAAATRDSTPLRGRRPCSTGSPDCCPPTPGSRTPSTWPGPVKLTSRRTQR